MLETKFELENYKRSLHLNLWNLLNPLITRDIHYKINQSKFQNKKKIFPSIFFSYFCFKSKWRYSIKVVKKVIQEKSSFFFKKRFGSAKIVFQIFYKQTKSTNLLPQSVLCFNQMDWIVEKFLNVLHFLEKMSKTYF